MEAHVQKPKHEEKIIRILSTDIEGGMKIYSGLTNIKGVSWSLSNAVCSVLAIDKKRKLGSLTEDEIKKISEFIKNPKIPKYLLNRRRDYETGEDKHLSGSDLELRKEFDIKRLKKIKSYKGFRHTSGQPVRGQRTKGHFRSNRKKSGGIKKKEKKEVTTKGVNRQ
jgi:small subunit ribosomal protein S13